jgi:hypothetical protein
MTETGLQNPLCRTQHTPRINDHRMSVACASSVERHQ